MLPSNPALDPFYEPDIEVIVSLWPSTWVWALIAIVICYRVSRKLAVAVRYWWGQRYRREALNRLQTMALDSKPEAVKQAHELLKIVAIYLWGRTRIARVAERDWYAFLNTHTPTPTFAPELGAQVFDLLYRDRLMSTAQVSEYIKACRNWIQTHEVHHEQY